MRKDSQVADDHANNKAIPPERMTFARNFRKARLAAKITQRGIRDRTGFSQSWICEVETGRSNINLDNMAVLANCVGVPLWQLLVPIEGAK